MHQPRGFGSAASIGTRRPPHWGSRPPPRCDAPPSRAMPWTVDSSQYRRRSAELRHLRPPRTQCRSHLVVFERVVVCSTPRADPSSRVWYLAQVRSCDVWRNVQMSAQSKPGVPRAGLLRCCTEPCGPRSYSPRLFLQRQTPQLARSLSRGSSPNSDDGF